DGRLDADSPAAASVAVRADWDFFGLLGLLLIVFLGVPRRFSASLSPPEGPPRPFADLRRAFHVPQRKRLPPHKHKNPGNSCGGVDNLIFADHNHTLWTTRLPNAAGFGQPWQG
ncbi:MAG: hypothetical protein ACUVQK_15965, partial [Thermogutta sp.]